MVQSTVYTSSGEIMILQNVMKELDIESEEDFRYFEQFSALMENHVDVDFDIFSELILIPDSETLTEMTFSFFEDLIQGVPDDNTELYAAIQTNKEILLSLAAHSHARSRAFFADELFRFRSWYTGPKLIKCTAETDGKQEFHTPCDALMLFREEKLSGKKYNYDFSFGMPPAPDEYTLNILDEFSEDPDLYYSDDAYDYSDNGFDSESSAFNGISGKRVQRGRYSAADYDGYNDFDDLPDELDHDFDPSSYDPENTDLLSSIDPYRDGFVDRYNPVIDGENYEEYERYEGYENLDELF